MYQSTVFTQHFRDPSPSTPYPCPSALILLNKGNHIRSLKGLTDSLPLRLRLCLRLRSCSHHHYSFIMFMCFFIDFLNMNKPKFFPIVFHQSRSQCYFVISPFFTNNPIFQSSTISPADGGRSWGSPPTAASDHSRNLR